MLGHADCYLFSVRLSSAFAAHCWPLLQLHDVINHRISNASVNRKTTVLASLIGLK